MPADDPTPPPYAGHASATPAHACARAVPAEQFAATVSNAVFHRYCNAAHGNGGVGGDNLVHAMRFASWVTLRTLYQIAQSGDGFPVYIVQ
jgi:hypothetical protein